MEKYAVFTGDILTQCDRSDWLQIKTFPMSNAWFPPVQVRGIVDDQMYVGFSSRNHEEPIATFYIINGETQAVRGPIFIDTRELAGNGEIAYITDISQYNEHVLLGYRTIKAGEDGSDNAFNSDFTDRTYIGVFTKELELVKVLEDTGRTGVVAGQSRSQGETGIEPVENGDLYVFSSALENENVPSGVLKINSGELDFDPEYFFNISEASGGYKLYRSYYVGGDTFVLQMFTDANTSSSSPAFTRNKFAVVNVVDKSFEWVEGVPQNIQAIQAPYIDTENFEVIFPIETNVYPTLYSVDASSGVMSPKLEVVAEGVGAVGKLSPQQ